MCVIRGYHCLYFLQIKGVKEHFLLKGDKAVIVNCLEYCNV